MWSFVSRAVFSVILFSLFTTSRSYRTDFYKIFVPVIGCIMKRFIHRLDYVYAGGIRCVFGLRRKNWHNFVQLIDCVSTYCLRTCCVIPVTAVNLFQLLRQVGPKCLSRHRRCRCVLVRFLPVVARLDKGSILLLLQVSASILNFAWFCNKCLLFRLI